MKITLSYCLLFVFIFSSACKKFLDVRPSTVTINPTTIEDFEEMLNNDSLAICDFTIADIISDDTRMSDAMLASDSSSYYARAYLWSSKIWNPGDEDLMYSRAYTRLLQLNIILTRIDDVAADAQRKNIVRAQAQINRAWYYLQLANLYGNDYLASSAASDLAVPLILIPNANELPARATVQQVYDQVIQDLGSAVASPDLPGMGQTIVHPGKAAGYALLAKTYLYLGDYTQAQNAADSCLAIRNTLLNYNSDYNMAGSLIDLSKNPEILLGKLGIDKGFYFKYYSTFLLGSDLELLLDSNDTRLLRNFSNKIVYNLSGPNYQHIFNYSVTVPDVILIKAECLARNGNDEEALSLLNSLRENRLINYVPVDITADILKEVLNERQRELFFHGGSRLFDIKRLNRESRFEKTLNRIADDNTTVIATIPANSPRFLMQFSPINIASNPNIVQNPR